MKTSKMTFEGSQGDSLAARLDMPDDENPRVYALFAHCFTCSKNLKAVVNIDKALTDRGVAVLRFDFTGLGESEGEFAGTNFSSNVEDLIAAADYMARGYRAPAILIGHSLGGAAVLQAAARIKPCKAVTTIAAPYDPEHVAKLLGPYREQIEREGEAEVILAGRTFRIRKQFLEDLEQEGLKKTLGSLGRALMIFHSPVDATVGIDNAALIFQAAKHPKSFVSLDKADHLLSNEADSHYVGRMIAEWASRYVV